MRGYGGVKKPPPFGRGIFGGTEDLLRGLVDCLEFVLVELLELFRVAVLENESRATASFGALAVLLLLDLLTASLLFQGEWLAATGAFSVGDDLLVFAHLMNSITSGFTYRPLADHEYTRT